MQTLLTTCSTKSSTNNPLCRSAKFQERPDMLGYHVIRSTGASASIGLARVL